MDLGIRVTLFFSLFDIIFQYFNNSKYNRIRKFSIYQRGIHGTSNLYSWKCMIKSKSFGEVKENNVTWLSSLNFSTILLESWGHVWYRGRTNENKYFIFIFRNKNKFDVSNYYVWIYLWLRLESLFVSFSILGNIGNWNGKINKLIKISLHII